MFNKLKLLLKLYIAAFIALIIITLFSIIGMIITYYISKVFFNFGDFTSDIISLIIVVLIVPFCYLTLEYVFKKLCKE